MTIESITSDAVLQKPIQIKVGKKEYKVARPCTATLILISKYISTLPIIEVNRDINAINYVLSVAHESNNLDYILAIMIVGAKKLKSPIGFIYKLIVKRLSEKISTELDPEETFNNTVKILNTLKPGFFLSSIIFLNEINLLKKTKI